MENEEKNVGIWGFLTDLLGLLIIVFILDMMGCGICKSIGHSIGDGINAFRERTEERGN
jgi:hypothetical protein